MGYGQICVRPPPLHPINASNGLCKLLVRQEIHVTVIWFIQQQVPKSPGFSNNRSLGHCGISIPSSIVLYQWTLGSMDLVMIKITCNGCEMKSEGSTRH